MVAAQQRKGYKVDSVPKEFTFTKEQKEYSANIVINFDDAKAERKYAIRGFIIELQRWLRTKTHRELAQWVSQQQVVSIGINTGSTIDEDTKAMINLAKSSGLSVSDLQKLIEQAKNK